VAVLRMTGSSGVARVLEEGTTATVGTGESEGVGGGEGAGDDVSGSGGVNEEAAGTLAAAGSAPVPRAPATAVFPMNARRRRPAAARVTRAIGFANREPTTRATTRDDASRTERSMASISLR
jgi:hypothetical protein